MCLDATFMAWMKAMVAGQEPDVTRPGVGYMFQGGSNAHNDDPSILVPPAGGAWNIEPPHLMAINPEPLDPAMSRDPNSGGPYVMYAGTPYEHLMIPVDPVAVGGAAE